MAKNFLQNALWNLQVKAMDRKREVAHAIRVRRGLSEPSTPLKVEKLTTTIRARIKHRSLE